MKAFCKILIVAALLFCCLATLCTLGVGAAGEKPTPLSPALHVLAAGTDMRVAALVGNDYAFSKEDFARAMNLSSLEYITVTSLPDPEKGALYAGSDGVVAGQTLRASDISLLTYESASDTVGQGSFTFTVNGSAYEMTCVVYTLASINASPTLAAVPAGVMSLSVYSNTPAHGVLGGYDPEGDELTFEVVSYPSSGILCVTDPAKGAYTYMPGKDFVGQDSFVYVLRDCYGNYSTAATVSISVQACTLSRPYDDLDGKACLTDALYMTELGLLSGTQKGSLYCFEPDRQVSRVDFLVTAMNAVGMTCAPVSNTGFADDADIPDAMKGYVKTAYEKGYVMPLLRTVWRFFRILPPPEDVLRSTVLPEIGSGEKKFWNWEAISALPEWSHSNVPKISVISQEGFRQSGCSLKPIRPILHLSPTGAGRIIPVFSDLLLLRSRQCAG